MLIFLKKFDFPKAKLSADHHGAKLMQSKTSLIVLGLSSTIWLFSGCSPKPSDQASTDQTSSSAVSSTQNQNNTPANVRQFAATANDAHDIAVLEDYNEKFQTMSIEFDRDLARLKQDGYLTTAMEIERRRDQARSATNMLKALNLETEQGRYIQGLLYDYWEKQYEDYAAPAASAVNTESSTSLTTLASADAQLKYWKATQSTQKS